MNITIPTPPVSFSVEGATFDKVDHDVSISLSCELGSVSPRFDLDTLWAIANVPGFSAYLIEHASTIYATGFARV